MTASVLKIIFAGTPNFAASHLSALINSKHKVIGVFTQPDRPAGRGYKIKSSPVKILAKKYNIPVFQPNSFQSNDYQNIISMLHADVMIVVAYGLILPKKVLDIPALGCLNIHGSLLPRWRGAAPIERSLWAGDMETGVSVIRMDKHIDTGDILNKISCPISKEDTSDSLYKKLSHLGVQCILLTLDQLIDNTIKPQVQDQSLVTYAKKLNKKEARIDWNLSAQQINRCVRAFNPWPGSYFIINNQQQIIKVWKTTVLPPYSQNMTPGKIICTDKNGIKIATSSGVLNIIKLQPAGKKIMYAHELLNARREWFPIGSVLT